MGRTFTDTAAVKAGAGVRTGFALVEMVRKRALQLDCGAPPLVDSWEGGIVSCAVEELAAGRVRLRPQRSKP